MNQFLKNVNKGNTTTWNGAVSNASTGSILADQFGRAGAQRGRPLAEVFAEQSALHSAYGLDALKFAFYLRTITRKVKFEDSVTEQVQKGQGNRDESLKRMLWYYVNMPETFFKNAWLIPYAGRYKDLFDLRYLAKQNDIEIVPLLLEEAVRESDLFLKYLPLQRAKSKIKTERSGFNNELAKEIAKLLNISYKELRKMKSSGNAHKWQQLISRSRFNDIEFGKIPGKALFNLVNGKFLKKHGLEAKYEKWLETQPIAKFTGYVHELGAKVKPNNKLFVKKTLDKQFLGLLELNKGAFGGRKVICAIDTSSSMTSSVMLSATQAGNVSCMQVAISLGIYFSSLMEGPFKDWVIRFSAKSHWAKLEGNSFSDKYLQVKNFGDYPSNTDFQSVIDSIVNTRKRHPQVPESDFPDTLLVVSDMQFDRSGTKSNYDTAIAKLKTVFSKEYCDRFLFIWWQVNGRVSDHPQTIDQPGGYVVSGFDGAIVSALLGGSSRTGTQPNMEEAIQNALDQELLNQLEL